jgi:hypothetical protein
MIFFILFLIVVLFAAAKMTKNKDLDILNVSILLSNLIYGSFYLITYFQAENPSEISNALIFAFLIFYIFIVIPMALVVGGLLAIGGKVFQK